jgi:hypothetical protein
VVDLVSGGMRLLRFGRDCGHHQPGDDYPGTEPRLARRHVD